MEGRLSLLLGSVRAPESLSMGVAAGGIANVNNVYRGPSSPDSI